MNFYTQQHKDYCGIGLHAKAMDVGILAQSGTILVHKNLPTTPEAFLRLVAPYRDDLVVRVECMFTLLLSDKHLYSPSIRSQLVNIKPQITTLFLPPNTASAPRAARTCPSGFR